MSPYLFIYLFIFYNLLQTNPSPGPAGCCDPVLVLRDLRQQDSISLAAGEKDRPPPAGLRAHWATEAGEHFCTNKIEIFSF